MFSQAFGLAERGKRSVDCLPGMEVLCTCSSKSSAEAKFGFDIFERIGRRLSLLVCEKTVPFKLFRFIAFMQN